MLETAQEYLFNNEKTFPMTNDSPLVVSLDQWPPLSDLEMASTNQWRLPEVPENDVFHSKQANCFKPTQKSEEQKSDYNNVSSAFINRSEEQDKPIPKIAELAYFCTCFFFLFAGFLPCQTLLTTVFGNLGYWALFVLYIFFTISIFYSPLIVQIFSLRVVLFSCSCLVVTFVISILVTLTNPEQLRFVILVSCALLGSALGPMWLSQGAYIGRIIQNAPQIVGKFNGTFLSTYFLAGIIGNLLIAFAIYLSQTPSYRLLFCILLTLCASGSALFVFLKEPQSKTLDFDTKSILSRTFTIIKERTILLTTPYSISLGLTSTFAWGTLPLLLPDPKLVPVLGCLYGVSNLICCALAGHGFDRFGWIPLGVYNLSALLLSMLSIMIAHSYQIIWLFFLGALLLGSLEGVENTIIQSTYMKQFPDNVSYCMAAFRITSGIGISIGFLLGLVLPYQLFIALVTFTTILGLALNTRVTERVKSQELESKLALFLSDSS
ncbi:uncharacterized protein LOC126315448 [Schistocerca gregaria]|uniref:uncharacterized protein LOC126315448 n=1 Tax=Schistocerca gregaria TaxID=7010 RepID=UPI00211EC425|nr:uncharacterized protein LOC126315448 [Schistocerca gregaria]